VSFSRAGHLPQPEYFPRGGGYSEIDFDSDGNLLVRMAEAFEEFQRAAKARIVDWNDLASIEELAPLTGDPRFAELRAKHGGE